MFHLLDARTHHLVKELLRAGRGSWTFDDYFYLDTLIDSGFMFQGVELR